MKKPPLASAGGGYCWNLVAYMPAADAMVIIAMVIMGRMKSAGLAAAKVRGRTRFRLVRLIMACRTLIQGNERGVKTTEGRGSTRIGLCLYERLVVPTSSNCRQMRGTSVRLDPFSLYIYAIEAL